MGLPELGRAGDELAVIQSMAGTLEIESSALEIKSSQTENGVLAQEAQEVNHRSAHLHGCWSFKTI